MMVFSLLQRKKSKIYSYPIYIWAKNIYIYVVIFLKSCVINHSYYYMIHVVKQIWS
jgi:hypothetical protein